MSTIEPPTSDNDTTVSISRRQRKAQASRQAMFEAALSAFDRQPIGLVSVLDITEAADVAKGVFYLHFRSKDEFLLSIWDHIQTTMLKQMRTAVEKATTDESRLRAVITAYHDTTIADPRQARFCLRLSSYLTDEIGPPGMLKQLRHTYLSAVHKLLTPSTKRTTSIKATSLAARLDAICWAIIWQTIRLDQSLPSRKDFTTTILTALLHK